ncbi:MAG: nucleoside deaminase [Acidobacteria bacterium]|nr:nucleoside deaminase [Acidobacteriota bacterium]
MNVKALPDDPLSTPADQEFIRRAYEIARRAYAHGNRPFGALLVDDGKTIAEYENRVNTSGDVTQHAETGLVALATPKFSPEILSRSILYTSTEPCIMCCGAIYWAGIPKMVFGTTASQMSKLLDRDYVALPAREVFQQIHPQMVVVGPVMEEEGLKVHSDSK